MYFSIRFYFLCVCLFLFSFFVELLGRGTVSLVIVDRKKKKKTQHCRVRIWPLDRIEQKTDQVFGCHLHHDREKSVPKSMMCYAPPLISINSKTDGWILMHKYLWRFILCLEVRELHSLYIFRLVIY